MNENNDSRRFLHNNQQHSNQPFSPDDERPPILEPETSGGSRSRIVEDDDGTFMDRTHHERPEHSTDGGDDPYLFEDGYYIDNGILYSKMAKTTTPSSSHRLPSSMGMTGSHYSRMSAAIPEEKMPTTSIASNYPPQQQNVQMEMDGGGDGIDSSSNVCCGLCGAIVLYELFVSDHLPVFHPEVLVDDGVIHLEEIPYETWLNEQQHLKGGKMLNRRSAAAGRRQSRHPPFIPQPPSAGGRRIGGLFGQVRSTRQLRRISQYRVNTAEMSIPELEMALQKKMVEKMGRKVPVSLMDKLHAKCGICDTVISLNKKFEIVHLVRHFNAWHPTTHKCAGTWPNKELPNPMSTGKPLSAQDFAVIDPDPEAADNLQCIWCGMFMSNRAIGMHFHEIHPEEVEVPKCNLCMQELLINARLAERFSEDFGVTLPDEHTFRSIFFKRDFKSEAALEKAIVKYLKRIQEGADPALVDIEDLDAQLDEDEDEEEGAEEFLSCRPFQNSTMACGRRAKPKRQFIAPIVRQAAPVDSKYVTAITHSHWKCKLCAADIFAAVISAGVIKHYKRAHRSELPIVQLELCQARLDKVSDGNMEMEMLTEENILNGICNIKCKLCNHSIPMTPPFNICRAIRHVKMKHPEVMPEHKGGESSRGTFPSTEELAEMNVNGPNEMADSKMMGGVGDLDYAQQPSTSGTAAAATGIAEIKAGHELEPGVIYASEMFDYSIIEMLRANCNNVNFDRVFSVYASDIDQEIFILTMANDELNSRTVEEVVKMRDPNQNPMIVVLNQQQHGNDGTIIDANDAETQND